MKQELLEVFSFELHLPTQDPFLFCAHHLDFYPKGDGNLKPSVSLAGRNLGNDFIPKDGWRMYHGLAVPGFPVHPHRGFETITIVEKGFVDHSDSYGGKARYGEGDVQWMTAGRGIQHAEMFPLLNVDKPNTLELFQIWLNLPANNKLVVPEFKVHDASKIPKLEILDSQNKRVNVKLITGHFAGYTVNLANSDSWANLPDNEVLILLITLEPCAQFFIYENDNFVTRSLYFYEGETCQINSHKITKGQGAFLDYKSPIQIVNGNQMGKILFLQGKPIQEPIVNYGPFVMNTKEEIIQAISDYQNQKFGKWNFPSLEPTHGTKGKFVEYPKKRRQR